MRTTFKKQDLNTIKAGLKVAKEAGKGEYWLGKVIEVKEDKALVYFPTRGLSRWCNTSNLDLVTNNL
jgi:hypothetical protein